jgi:hypothetical protein
LLQYTRSRGLGIPAFHIFGNKVLEAIAAAAPSSTGELRAIKGVGPMKFEDYGAEILSFTRGAVPTPLSAAAVAAAVARSSSVGGGGGGGGPLFLSLKDWRVRRSPLVHEYESLLVP